MDNHRFAKNALFLLVISLNDIQANFSLAFEFETFMDKSYTHVTSFLAVSLAQA